MTWQLLLFVVFSICAIGLIFYISFMEIIIESKGIQHSLKNYLKGPVLLIKKINKFNNLKGELKCQN